MSGRLPGEHRIEATFIRGVYRLETAEYGDGSLALLGHDDEGGRETLSVNLIQHGLVAPAGQFYVKDYSEHEGLADALVTAGVATKGEPVEVGPFGSTCYLMTLRAVE